MILTSLKLTQFRNFSERSVDLSELALIVGPNGVGKTNLLEAIRMLSLMKSFRARADQEAIQFDKQFFRISGQLQEQKRSTMTLYLGKDEQGKLAKVAKIDGVTKRLTEAIGFVKTVLFTADEINLVAGSPQKRRHFLDFLLSQLDRKYLFALSQYKHVLRQRNELLNWVKLGQASSSDLEPWDEPLLEHGQYLIGQRQGLVDFFNQVLPEQLRVSPLFKLLSRETLSSSLPKDIQFSATTLGPHRDDFDLVLNNRSLQKYGSRGQWRKVVTLLKVAEVEYIFHVSKTKPVLLADDLFSELDLTNRQLVAFRNVGQSIYTTPEISLVPDAIKKQAQIIELGA